MNTKTAINAAHNDIVDSVSGALLISKIKGLFAKIIARIKLMDQIRIERQELSRMSPKMLADLGIDAESARQEYIRRYFDLPGGRWWEIVLTGGHAGGAIGFSGGPDWGMALALIH